MLWLKLSVMVMDYYKMKNIEADTSMRESIAKPNDKKNTQK